MISALLAKIIGTANARTLRRLRPLVEAINSHEAGVASLNDEQLAAKTVHFREQLSQGKSLDDLIPEAFAVVREAARRALGQRHFDVQLIGGIVLHQGKIAEMKTGEGKTLTATLPLYLNALTGKGAHLVTVNEYLAQRDAEWMGLVYKRLGMTVGVLKHSHSDHEKKAAYQSDILYATNNELGFDYLRDNMKFRLSDYAQQDLNFAIVDEVDSILIDEARTPLIISGPTDESSKLYIEINRIIPRLEAGVDYEVDERERAVFLTESGNDKVEAALGLGNIYAAEHMSLVHHVKQALRAHVLFKRDVDYVVKDDQIMIVDEFTGRILVGRRYSDGLHQALEAKEGITVQRESQTLAAITLQNYFRLYKKLAGMTGTAMTEAEEFHKIYKLDVVSIPTNQPMIRVDKSDLVFLTRRAKDKAIIADIKERYQKGQPVLVGTIAIETSEQLSEQLTANAIPHEVLNAKQHMREAEIIAHAGEVNRVTIATNMAGRGTDIKLTPGSLAVGGLYILGTERHESRRIDDQLRGRSGRQGDPGESRFYLSLEDSLIRRFSGDSLRRWMERFGMTEDEVIEDKNVTKVINHSQEKVEKQNFEIRRQQLEYDDVLNHQRKVIYAYRRSILEGGQNSADLVRDLIAQTAVEMVQRVSGGRALSREQYDFLINNLHQMTGTDKQRLETECSYDSRPASLSDRMTQALWLLYDLYRSGSATASEHIAKIQEAERWMILDTLDDAWKQHMLNLDHLREGIGLRSFGQKNPLIEYKREAFALFQDMLQEVRMVLVHHVFHLNIENFNRAALERRREQELEQVKFHSAADQSDDSSAGGSGEATVVRSEQKIGRNDDCPCGSGKKYKKCCGQRP